MLARAAVGPEMDCRLETTVKELTAKRGQTVNIPVKVHRVPGKKGDIALVVNGPTPAAGTGMGPPRPLKADENEVLFPLTIDKETQLGTRGIVVARAWASDIRAGRPGPCTPIILLHVKE